MALETDLSGGPQAGVVNDLPDGWWRRPFSVFQTNLQEIDATLDVEQTLDFIQGYGADTWLLNTGGIVAFHPSDLSFQTRNPFLVNRASGDLVGDAVSAAHQRGVRIISRMDFSKVSARIAEAHPDWLFVSPKGEPQIYNTLYSTCPSADYYQHRSLDILDEVIDRYPVDGVFFNWFGFSERDYSRVYHGVCHCAKCREGFAAFSGGKELPDGPSSPAYAQWLQFANQVITRLTARIAGHITTRRPDAALVLGRGAPVVYYEANNAFGRELWPHQTAEAVSAHVTGLPEIALMVNSVSFVDMPYRMAGEQPEHFAQYLLQAIARGGNPSTYIMGAPGRIPYAHIRHSTEITKFYRSHRQLYEQLVPGSSIALVRPDRLRSASPGYAESVEEFRGLYCCLQERHLPFEVIGAELISKMNDDGNLARYSLIILPHLGSLGRQAADALDGFVRQGGNLVLTGTSGVPDSGAMELATAPSLMQVGGGMSGGQLWGCYIASREQPEIGSYRYAPPVIPVYGNYARFVWKPGVEKRDQLLPQAPFGPPEKCYGHVGSQDPGMALAETGGKVLQLPWTIGYAYREFGITEIRDYFLSAVDGLCGQRVYADLPEQVELFLGRDADGLVVHLVNESGARRRSFGPHLKIEGGRLTVRGDTGAAAPELLVSKEAPDVHKEGSDLVIDLPPLELFEVVRIPMASPIDDRS